jgi:hypothetical protein
MTFSTAPSAWRTRFGLRAGVRLALYMVIAALLRWLLFTRYPALITADSPDYIEAARDLATRLDFFSEGLGSIRMPGYPLFLALLYGATGLRTDGIVLAQTVVGLLCVPLGWYIGRALRSQPTADALALFFVFNPVYLLLEHTLLTEGLSIFTMLIFTLLAVTAVNRPPSPWLAFGTAVMAGVCSMVRINLLPFCAALMALVLTRWLLAIWLREPRLGKGVRSLLWPHDALRRLRAVVTILAPTALGIVLIFGPWLWRNYAAYGVVSFSEHGARSLLMWKTMSGTVDPTLPTYRQYANGHTNMAYAWLLDFSNKYPTAEAENIAEAIMAEQMEAHPLRHLLGILASALNSAGIYLEGYAPGDDRGAVAWWFQYLVSSPTAVQESFPELDTWMDYAPITTPSSLLPWWSSAGLFYLQVVRPTLVLGSVFAFALMLYQLWRRQLLWRSPPVQSVLVLGGAYYLTYLFHALTLTGSDRFAVISDWIALLLIVFAATQQPSRTSSGLSTEIA